MRKSFSHWRNGSRGDGQARALCCDVADRKQVAALGAKIAERVGTVQVAGLALMLASEKAGGIADGIVMGSRLWRSAGRFLTGLSFATR